MAPTDNRFPSPGTDTRFQTPGTDARFPSPGSDTRFPSPGSDTRFDGSPPAPVGTHDLLIGTQGGIYGFTAGAFGGLTPDTLAGFTLVNMTVGLTGDQMLVTTTGGVRITDVSGLGLDLGSGLGQLEWRASDSGYVGDVPGAFATLQAALGTTIPIQLITTPVNVALPVLTLIDSDTANYARGEWTANPTSYTASIWTVDGSDNWEEVIPNASPGNFEIQPEWLGKSLSCSEQARNDAGPGNGPKESIHLPLPPAPQTPEEALIAFLAGRVGYGADPRDLSTLFQESTALTPVTAAGQPVGAAKTKFAPAAQAAGMFIQATAAARPLYGTNKIDFDGVDDQIAYDLSATVFANNPGTVFCMKVTPSRLGVEQSIMVTGNSNTARHRIILNANGSVNFIAFDGVSDRLVASAVGALQVGVPALLTMGIDFVAKVMRARINGVQVGQIALQNATSPVTITINRQRVFINVSNAFPVQGSLQRLFFMHDAADDAGLATIEAWVGEF
jgi:hypothetical protein